MTEHRGLLRRGLGAAAGVALGLLVLAPAALADFRGPIEDGGWAGSRIDTPERVSIPNQTLTAVIKDPNPLARPDVLVTFGRAPGIPSECSVVSGEAVPGSSGSGGTLYSVTTSVDCNGAYPYVFEASVSGVTGRSYMPALSSTLTVEVPPAAVAGVSAALIEGTRNVRVSWDAAADPAPDFLGYVVQRRLGAGQWTDVAEARPKATSLVDNEVPAEGGEYTYRVLARRSGVGRELESAQGATDRVTLPAGDPGTSTTLPGDPGPTVPGDPGGPGGTDGTGAPPPDGGTGAPGKPNVIKGSARPRITPRAPNLGSPAQSNLGILLNRPPGLDDDSGDGDGGYDEALDYGDPSIDGSLADEEEGSSIFYAGERRGLAIPVATGFVLFAWAIHLRFLARASRPEPIGSGSSQYYDDPFDPFYDPMH